PYLTVAVAGPGRNAGVIVVEINLRFIWDVIARIQLGRGGSVYLVDERGLVIGHPDIGVVLRKTDLSRLRHVALALSKLNEPKVDVPAVSEDRVGRQVLTASAPIGALGWVVVVESPLSEAFEPVYGAIYRTVIVFAVGLLGAVAISVWL